MTPDCWPTGLRFGTAPRKYEEAPCDAVELVMVLRTDVLRVMMPSLGGGGGMLMREYERP